MVWTQWVMMLFLEEAWPLAGGTLPPKALALQLGVAGQQLLLWRSLQ